MQESEPAAEQPQDELQEPRGDVAEVQDPASEKQKLEESLQLRHAQLKASEEELKELRRQLDEFQAKFHDRETELQRAQSLLGESEKQYRNLVDNLPLMLAVQDVRKAQHVFWNRETNWSGHTLAEWNRLTSDERRELIHPDDYPQYIKQLNDWEIGEFKKPLKLDYRQKDRSGDYRTIECLQYREFAADGSVIAQIELSHDVTAEKRFDEALHNELDKYSILESYQTELIYKTKLDGEFVYASPAYCEAFDQDLSKLIGAKFSPQVHEDDREATQQSLEDLTHPPYESYFEHRTLMKTGWRWIAWSVKALKDSSGRMEALVGIGHDISARKRAEGSMRDSQRNLTRLLDSLDDLIVIFKPAGNLLFLNQALYRRLGLKEAETANRTILDLYPPERENEVIQMLADLVEEKLGVNDIAYVSSGGTQIPVTTKLAVWIWDGQSAIFSISRESGGTVIPGEVFGAGELGSLLTNNSPTGMALLQDGIVRYVNPILAEALGRSVKYLLDLPPLGFENLMVPEDRERLFARPSDPSQLADGMIVQDLRMTRERGEPAHFDAAIKAVSYQGKPAWLIVLFDAGYRVKMEEMRSSLETDTRLEEKMEAVSRLAGGTAHSFNNLLTVVNGHTEMLRGALGPSSPHLHELETIRKTAKKGSTLTRQLLTIAGMQADRAQLVDLNKVLGDNDSLLRRLLGDQITLKFSLASDLWNISADPDLLQQVILNLTDNSHDALPEGGTFTIRTSNVKVDDNFAAQHPAFTKGSYVTLAFSDNGVGMTEEVRSRIFDPYYKGRDTDQGGGLGLSVVWGAVKHFGGHIWVKSQPGRGTSFTLFFPRIEDDERQTATNSSETEGKKTILIAEDEDSVREMAANILKTHGFRVIEARDGRDAFLICEKMPQPVDLVIADVVMPNMDGSELAYRLRVLWPNTPVLLMSGYYSGIIGKKGKSEEFPFLQKPFDPLDLTSKVTELLLGK